ncbi:hypothetical protein V6N12_007866 [Hibiscus sabdariffa]|uniref:RNase H type-1 domain-containing protein n=1 Tax=Hibiscus sabdariffa TaxID=183260 RepID=A0ABR2F303_9ROSI
MWNTKVFWREEIDLLMIVGWLSGRRSSVYRMRQAMLICGSALVEAIHELQQREWQTRITHVCRERNEVANKLACLGRQQTLEGGMFVVPPDVVANLVDDK